MKPKQIICDNLPYRYDPSSICTELKSDQVHITKFFQSEIYLESGKTAFYSPTGHRRNGTWVLSKLGGCAVGDQAAQNL